MHALTKTHTCKPSILQQEGLKVQCLVVENKNNIVTFINLFYRAHKKSLCFRYGAESRKKKQFIVKKYRRAKAKSFKTLNLVVFQGGSEDNALL